MLAYWERGSRVVVLHGCPILIIPLIGASQEVKDIIRCMRDRPDLFKCKFLGFFPRLLYIYYFVSRCIFISARLCEQHCPMTDALERSAAWPTTRPPNCFL